MIIFFWIVAFMVLCFAFVLLFGAPYLPTLTSVSEQALDLLELKPGQTLLDLGSGDGTVLLHAAQRGVASVGYELNPLLFIYSWLRTRRYRGLISVRFGNFWQAQWPEADAIFVFLHTRFMKRLDQRLVLESRSRAQTLLSFTFEVPGREPVTREGGLHLYKYEPTIAEKGRVR